ncbi:peptidylprolyl isomerase [bacterium]|nr:MAG: peptidylprolyl isomerase [bacterium]
MILRAALVPFLLLAAFTQAQAETVKLVLSIEGRGDVTMQLLTDKAPKTCAQIERLATSGFYNGLRFHREERTPRPFLVEVGDPRSRDSLDAGDLGTKGSGSKIPFEPTDVPQEAGIVGLVRDQADKNSGDSSFYILLAPARFLDNKYTAFAKVISGKEIVEKIKRGDRITSAKIVRTP